MTKGVLLALLLIAALLLSCCKAKEPSDLESELAAKIKKMKIGGKDLQNPTSDTPETVKTGMEHFQHHCQVCHGLDGHNTGIPFAGKMSPPVIDLGDKDVQQYTDGQLKWIIENGVRYSGMPGWKDVLEDNEMWSIVRFLRHLPEKGSQGVPDIYKEAEEEHHHLESGSEHGRAGEHQHHQH